MTVTFLFPILVMMFLAHANSYDMVTGALNLETFEDYIRQKKNHYILCCLRFDTEEDMVLPQELAVVMRSFWGQKFRNAKLFNPIPNMYILGLHTKQEVEVMKELYDTVFLDCYRQYRINYKILIFPKNDNFVSFRDVNETFLHLAERVEENQLHVFSEEEIKGLDRGFAILEELKDIYQKFDLNDERIVPYYQPIYHVDTRRYDTAESLMRLNIKSLGQVFPDEFIPLIEKNDLMHRFSMIMLNKVCQHLNQLPEVERVSINFSISELKTEHFVEDLARIIQDNNVKFQRIGIEFTEEMNNSEFHVIKKVVKELKNLGCKVYLDDFGTGYSNFDRVLGLNMDVIKFDRSLLWMAADEDNARYFINAFSDTFTKVGFSILYEGVEMEEQEKICIESHANYLQGYKFSRPVSYENYVKFLEKQ